MASPDMYAGSTSPQTQEEVEAFFKDLTNVPDHVSVLRTTVEQSATAVEAAIAVQSRYPLYEDAHANADVAIGIGY